MGEFSNLATIMIKQLVKALLSCTSTKKVVKKTSAEKHYHHEVLFAPLRAFTYTKSSAKNSENNYYVKSPFYIKDGEIVQYFLCRVILVAVAAAVLVVSTSSHILRW